jgi:hypothetical protein
MLSGRPVLFCPGWYLQIGVDRHSFEIRESVGADFKPARGSCMSNTVARVRQRGPYGDDVNLMGDQTHGRV